MTFSFFSWNKLEKFFMIKQDSKQYCIRCYYHKIILICYWAFLRPLIFYRCLNSDWILKNFIVYIKRYTREEQRKFLRSDFIHDETMFLFWTVDIGVYFVLNDWKHISIILRAMRYCFCIDFELVVLEI